MKELLLVFALVGCGYEIPEEETALEESKDAPADEVDEKSDRDSVNVNVETTVTVNVGSYEATTGKWILVETRRTFAAARDAAPEGYRLPTQLELLEGFLSDQFVDYEASVWTSDRAEDRDDYVFFFKLGDGKSFAYPSSSLFSALYIVDDVE